jgi:hypothetical protein
MCFFIWPFAHNEYKKHIFQCQGNKSREKNDVKGPVFRIRIRTWIRIRMFLGLSDPYADPFVRGTDPRIRIRIRTKMSPIPKNDKFIPFYF